MKFINRESELGELERLQTLAKARLFTTLIFGPRRVGKTELVKQFARRRKHIHFFVYEGKTASAILEEFEKELKAKGVISEEVKLENLDSFIRLLFRECGGYCIVFDEIQFMRRIYPAFFSVLQREIDEHQRFPAHFIFLGSTVGLIKKIFEDMKSPLYGRMKSTIALRPFDYATTRLFLRELGYSKEEDFVRFYSIFGGFPKYYIAMEDYELGGKDPLEVMGFLFFRHNAPLRDEVQSVLRQEFGAGKSYYYHILEAIASGHTKLNEIASHVGSTSTAIMPFIHDLLHYYEIIERKHFAGEKGRRTFYQIKSPIFAFWFRYIYPNMGMFEREEYGQLVKEFRLTANSFFGKGFERVCTEALVRLNGQGKLPFTFTEVGPYLGYYRDRGVRKTFELDALAMDKAATKMLFCEMKWKDGLDAHAVLGGLRAKAAYVQRKGDREESYAIFAKSFKRKIEEPGLFLYDLDDIRRIFS